MKPDANGAAPSTTETPRAKPAVTVRRHHCDPDECVYAYPAPTMDGCDRTVCREHDDDEIVQWHDGADSGWLHARGTCADCDRLWEDVDANTAYYAEQGTS